ncbi:MAG: efflux RND transporter permease subunit, partial [Bacteroidota bacterium]
MNLTRLSLDNSRVTLTLVLVATVLGISTYQELERNSMPPFTVRVAQVVTAFPGAGPERVESLVTDPLEQVVQELPELDFVTSESRTGVSIIMVNVRDDIPKQNLQETWDKLRRKIDAIRSTLPDNISEPDIKDDGIGVVYGIMLGMENDGFTLAELADYADLIKGELIRIDDAARVKVMGLQEEQIFIEYDHAKLAQVGLSAGQLQSYIASTNILFPGGQVNLQDERIILEPTGNFESLRDLERLLIPVGQMGESVYLGDISIIRRAYESPRERIVRVNGSQGLAISVSLKEGANIVELGKQIDTKVAELSQELPLGINLYR